MIEPQAVRERAQKLWDSGRVLRAVLGAEDLFPCDISLGRPSTAQIVADLARVRAWAQRLLAHGKQDGHPGYTLVLQEQQMQKLGQQTLPLALYFESAEDLAACIGRTAELRQFVELARQIESAQPSLRPWLCKRPLQVLAHAPDWPRLLETLRYFQRYPQPQRYARELDILGVDSKFIETRKGPLRELLDLCLPPEAVAQNETQMGGGGFERRYGLRYDPPPLRLRLLDERLKPGWAMSDLSMPANDFAALNPPCESVFVVENKINALSFPPVAGGIVVFGQGYGGMELLQGAAWLRERALYYWGDLDTHGFAILSRLRAHFPHATSLLMDRETLLAHRTSWVTESQPFAGVLPGLNETERSLYEDLRDHRLATCLRLEQERIRYSHVISALRNTGLPVLTQSG